MPMKTTRPSWAKIGILLLGCSCGSLRSDPVTSFRRLAIAAITPRNGLSDSLLLIRTKTPSAEQVRIHPCMPLERVLSIHDDSWATRGFSRDYARVRVPLEQVIPRNELSSCHSLVREQQCSSATECMTKLDVVRVCVFISKRLDKCTVAHLTWADRWMRTLSYGRAHEVFLSGVGREPLRLEVEGISGEIATRVADEASRRHT